jgi:rhodanese-related sulfurtransferase
LSKEELQLSDVRQPSGYARPRIEASLPKQSLLIYWDKEEGGQKLSWLGLSKKKGRGV